MNRPVVTLAIPTFRRLEYLQQAVRSALAQTYSPLEIIVSDNCSGDDTAAWLHSVAAEPSRHTVRVLEQTENLGMVGNWNACLAAATGTWFLLLSDDDYLQPAALTVMIEALGNAPDPERVGVVYCRCRTVDGTGRELALAPAMPQWERTADFALAFFRRERVLFPCGVLLRTEDLRAQGGFRADGITLGCDAIAWSNAAIARGEVVCSPGILSNYRVHPGNLTSTSQLTAWMTDLKVLIALWQDAFRSAPDAAQAELRQACASYYTEFLARVLAGSGAGWRGALRGLRRFFQYRHLFLGSARGRLHLLTGVARLLLPGWLEIALRRTKNAIGARQQEAQPTAAAPLRTAGESAR